jgi:acyl-coenzyme A synthetase/AMP-(fatty) acid ligase
VFGVEHPDLGQEVAAVVVTTATEEELRAFLAERVAYYKVPTRWQLTADPLPRTATGKIVRSELRLDG